MKEFLDGPEIDGSIFAPLRDPKLFRKARVEMGTVVWPNGADLAPDAMYDAILADGRWVVPAKVDLD